MTPPDDNTRSILTNPYITGFLGAALTALASFGASLLSRKPSLQAQINDSFAELRESYRKTFEDMTATIADLKTELEELNGHVQDLTAVLEKHGITPPARRRKAVQAAD